jgi:hypothetical protein
MGRLLGVDEGKRMDNRPRGRRGENSGAEGEADAPRTRVSTLLDYATTGVKRQAFVPLLFYKEVNYDVKSTHYL